MRPQLREIIWMLVPHQEAIVARTSCDRQRREMSHPCIHGASGRVAILGRGCRKSS
jgi:hypothetical protein